MPSLNQRGVIQFVVLLLLLGGVAAGLVLIKNPAIFDPRASQRSPVPEVSFSLEAYNKPYDKVEYKVGEEGRIDLYFRSDLDEANLLVAKLKFPADLIEVTKLDHAGTETVISSWTEEHFDNATGEISLVGGIPAPGFKTTIGGFNPLMSRIHFKVKAKGTATIDFMEGSAIYRNSDNTNILVTKRPITLSSGGISELPPDSGEGKCKEDKDCGVGKRCEQQSCPQPMVVCPPGTDQTLCQLKECPKTCVDDTNAKECVSDRQCPAGYLCDRGQPISRIDDQGNVMTGDPMGICRPKPKPSPTPPDTGNTGDGNKDGKIDLVDLSVLLSDFNKEKGFRVGVDLNGDGKINTFDFALMRNLLIEKGIIKGTNSPLP